MVCKAKVRMKPKSSIPSSLAGSQQALKFQESPNP